MENRPKIIPKLSNIDKKIELLCTLLFVLIWGFTIFLLYKLPTIIPVHFDVMGKVDKYGNKTTLLILPIIATFVYIGLKALNKYPYIFNYATKITTDNALKQYGIATRLIRFINLAIQLIISIIILFVYFTISKLVDGLGFWFLPFVFGILIIPTIISIKASLQHK